MFTKYYIDLKIIPKTTYMKIQKTVVKKKYLSLH